MKTNPKTEDEIATARLLPAGVYDFTVTKAQDSTSKNGNDMIALTLMVYDGADDRTVLVNDYLLDIESMAYKLRHACDACGLLPEYEAGEIRGDDFMNRSGKVKIGIDDKNKDYPPKNVVKDYVVREKGDAAAPRAAPRKPAMASSAPADGFDDEIPF